VLLGTVYLFIHIFKNIYFTTELSMKVVVIGRNMQKNYEINSYL